MDASSTERPLDELVDEAQAFKRNCYFVEPPIECDLCKCAFNEEKYLIDGRLKGVRAWAFMCADCFAEQGSGIGWGVGQLYRRERDSSWLLVSGFNPNTA